MALLFSPLVGWSDGYSAFAGVTKTMTHAVQGVILLDKPEGLSSNTALQIVKRLYKADKAGHAGTLDPMATGMLPICMGQATKFSEYLLAEDKCYRATIQLGKATATGDKEGEVIAQAAVPPLSSANIQSILQQFSGTILQIPPMYSALKHQGQPLYKLARQGREIERKARAVQIYHLDLVAFTDTTLTILTRCSKGTYIRTLADDIAKALGSVGHLTALRRCYSGGFAETGMHRLEALKTYDSAALQQALLPMETLLPVWPKLTINADELQRLFHGKSVQLDSTACGSARLILGDKIVALATLVQGQITERKLFNY